MTVGSLFSGIGGLDLGFELAGFDIKWMCEKDGYARKILNRRFPDVPVYEDITRLTSPPKIDCLIGGFPCQDISVAGKGEGLNGTRSGLWWEMYRLICLLRPQYVVLENVAALVTRGLPVVLGCLSEAGYDAEWQIVSAASVGSPHIRERIFIVAYPNRVRQSQQERSKQDKRGRFGDSCEAGVGNHPQRLRQPRPGEHGRRMYEKENRKGEANRAFGFCEEEEGYWDVEPNVGRVAHGVPSRVDRLRCLGNAVVPQVAYYIAQCVMNHDIQRRDVSCQVVERHQG